MSLTNSCSSKLSLFVYGLEIIWIPSLLSKYVLLTTCTGQGFDGTSRLHGNQSKELCFFSSIPGKDQHSFTYSLYSLSLRLRLQYLHVGQQSHPRCRSLSSKTGHPSINRYWNDAFLFSFYIHNLFLILCYPKLVDHCKTKLAT